MGILCTDFNNINLDYTNYNKDDPETIVHDRFFPWYSEKRKAFKKELNEEFMLIACHL